MDDMLRRRPERKSVSEEPFQDLIFHLGEAPQDGRRDVENGRATSSKTFPSVSTIKVRVFARPSQQWWNSRALKR
jgi:hypothetical protein